jgi:hypothetical protein
VFSVAAAAGAGVAFSGVAGDRDGAGMLIDGEVVLGGSACVCAEASVNSGRKNDIAANAG